MMGLRHGVHRVKVLKVGPSVALGASRSDRPWYRCAESTCNIREAASALPKFRAASTASIWPPPSLRFHSTRPAPPVCTQRTHIIVRSEKILRAIGQQCVVSQLEFAGLCADSDASGAILVLLPRGQNQASLYGCRCTQTGGG